MSQYKILRAGEAPDFTGGKVPSPFLGYGRPLGSEQIALNVRVLAPGADHVPPGGDPSGGHHHRTIEEIYLVIDGEIEMKLGDDVHRLGPRDAVLIPADTPRGTRNPTDAEAAFAMISVKVEDPMAETVMVEDHWPTG
jgi:mannose-6-phosphate isomerase-like protein (cupin superfamily)